MGKRVGDIIQYAEIEKWHNGDTILINAPTGSGKSFWVTTYLLSHCRMHNKSILWLTNRDIVKEQNNEAIKDGFNNVLLMNYQKLEQMLKDKVILKDFDYIVADECHYFFSDSLFNCNTKLSFDWISKQKSKTIFMSATIEIIEKYFKSENIDTLNYIIPADYSFINKFYFYNNDLVLNTLFENLPANEKVIYFTSIQKAQELNKRFNNSTFICSEHNNHYKFSDQKTKKQIINEEKFDCQILCSTTVLDNGVNIKDRKVKHIVIDYFDLDVIQQCVGRKRILDNDDRVNIYIKNHNRFNINKFKRSIDKSIKQAKYLIENGEEKFINKFDNQDWSPVIDVYWNNNRPMVKINKIMNIKYQTDLSRIDAMLNQENGFVKLVLDRFQWCNKEWKILDAEVDKKTLNDKLDELVGVKIFKEDQKKFKDFLLTKLLETPKVSHKCIGLRTINSLFEDYDLNYVITSRQETKKENRNKTYWIISKL